jgi:hypothetical protein
MELKKLQQIVKELNIGFQSVLSRLIALDGFLANLVFYHRHQ